MRVLLIDDDAFFKALARKFLERDLPGTEVDEYDPGAMGFPVAQFDWSRYDVVLLGHELGSQETGLDWLKSMQRTQSTLPPTIYVRDAGQESVDGVARKLGAYAVLGKHDIGGTRLADLVGCVAGSRAVAPSRSPVTRSPGVSRARPKPVIEGYTLGAMIGQGAMSRVYLGDRLGDHLTVVLKVIDLDFANNHAHVLRFVEEAELISGLDSPYVVKIHEQGFTDECGFIAMEFFPRGDLKQRIEYGIPPGDAVHCLANIAYGLDAIHRVGVVHRDLKPANVMFRSDDTLALADFGISRRLASQSELMNTGTVLGTPHYMSPEQGQGKPVDVRNDLYSLGIIFYEMLAGEKPYNAETPARLVYKQIHEPVPRLARNLRRYQPVVDRLLAKDPDARFPSATALIDALMR